MSEEMPSKSDNGDLPIPQGWEWSLRLFASVDLIGSTSFKSARKDGNFSNWAHAFSTYFEEFPNILAEQCELPFSSRVNCKPKRNFETWKFLGDEILFSVEIEKYTDCLYHIYYFIQAIKKYMKKYIKVNKLPLSLKGTAWIAGFPVQNRIISTKTLHSGSLTDYIGPQIDTGFRLAGFSTERRFVISIDLAMMLLDGYNKIGVHEFSFCIVLLQRAALKGVLGGDPYPILYLDMEDGKQNDEDILLGNKPISDKDILLRYIIDFIEKRKPYLQMPFIENDDDQRYCNIPEEFKNQRIKLLNQLYEFDFALQQNQPVPEPIKGESEKAPRDPIDPKEQ